MNAALGNGHRLRLRLGRPRCRGREAWREPRPSDIDPQALIATRDNAAANGDETEVRVVIRMRRCPSWMNPAGQHPGRAAVRTGATFRRADATRRHHRAGWDTDAQAEKWHTRTRRA